MRQPLCSNASEYGLSTLPRHHSCPFCASSTNVDAGAAIHSLARYVASCTRFVLRSICDCPSLLARSRLPLPNARTHSRSRPPHSSCCRRIHHGAKIVTIGRAITTQPLSLYIYAAAAVGQASSAVTAVQALRVSNTRRSTRTPSGCHAHGTLVAYRTPTFLDKTPSPATSRNSPPGITRPPPLSLFLSLASGEQPACHHHIANHSLSDSTRNCLSFWLPNTTPCPSDPSHSLDEQLDCRPSYR